MSVFLAPYLIEDKWVSRIDLIKSKGCKFVMLRFRVLGGEDHMEEI